MNAIKITYLNQIDIFYFIGYGQGPNDGEYDFIHGSGSGTYLNCGDGSGDSYDGDGSGSYDGEGIGRGSYDKSGSGSKRGNGKGKGNSRGYFLYHNKKHPNKKCSISDLMEIKWGDQNIITTDKKLVKEIMTNNELMTNYYFGITSEDITKFKESVSGYREKLFITSGKEYLDSGYREKLFVTSGKEYLD